MPNGNGLQVEEGSTALPPTREAIIEQGLRIQQETAAERDELRREVNGLKADITAYKVMVEALQAQLAEADSRVASMVVTRDDAVRRQAEVETVLASMLALGRAFQIKSEPLITGEGDYADKDQRDPRDDRDFYYPRHSSDLG
jgi:chromosome segregation ATPase